MAYDISSQDTLCTAKWDRNTLLKTRHVSTHKTAPQQVTGSESLASSVTNCDAQNMVMNPYTFSKEQEEYLLGFLKASFTPVAEILGGRIVKLENDLEMAMKKLNDHSLLLESTRLPVDFQAYVPSEGDDPWTGFDAAAPQQSMCSVVSDVGHVLNADAAEFVPLSSAGGAATNRTGVIMPGEADGLPDAVEWLLLKDSRHVQFKRYSYSYRRAHIAVPRNVAEFERSLRDPNITANKVDLYGGGKRAIVSACRSGTPEQRQFDVDNTNLLLTLIKENNIKITSHFVMS